MYVNLEGMGSIYQYPHGGVSYPLWPLWTPGMCVVHMIIQKNNYMQTQN